ncbi:Peptidase S28 [Penicillium cosmopolitanum]|uniref:Peptidase S28 n=1 Tax=Penicillium cosmopolitanum TaxID=1131564 RepID=A0A9W9VN68_9EURO|nr:Peptidase S28 [Penicillium cosmopolitanum]KAJ5386243.1 Peptidase S28 [Penicillium cosmopolitanum]
MLKSVIYFKTYSRLVLISQQNVQKGSKRLPGPNGVGLNKALHGYAKWFKDIYFPGYRSVDNAIDRQWQWFLCNEPLFYWQDAAPSSVSTLVSRTVNAEYWQRQCPLFFPEVNGHTFGSANGKTAGDVNSWTNGWDLTNTTRLIWANGYVSSDP